MALVNCPECGGSVSDQADFCIHCGHPLRKINTSLVSSKLINQKGKRRNILMIIMIIGVLVFSLGGFIYNQYIRVPVNGIYSNLFNEIGTYNFSPYNDDHYNGTVSFNLQGSVIPMNFSISKSILSIQDEMQFMNRKYIVFGKYLLEENDIGCKVPSNGYFEVSCNSQYVKYSFMTNGNVTSVSNQQKNVGTYSWEGRILTLSFPERDYKLVYYKGKLYYAYVKF